MNRQKSDVKKSDKKDTRKVRKGYFRGGIISGLLTKLTDAVYNAFESGLFGRIFTSFSKKQTKFDNGYISGYLFGSGNFHRSIRGARSKMSEKLEHSLFAGWLQRLERGLLSTPLKTYGNYFLSFGLYTVLAYFTKGLVSLFGEQDHTMLFVGLVIIVASLPLLASKNSLARAVGTGRMTRALFENVFGFRDEMFDVRPKRTKLRANLSIILGMLSGVSTLWISPIYILMFMAMLVAVALIAAAPEIGVIAALFLIPFYSFGEYPSLLLAITVLVTAFGYILKLVRGKRIISFDLLDVFVVIFMALLFFSGAISVGGVDSFAEALLCCVLMAVYFLVVNMMRTEAWIRRCVVSLVASATVVSLVGIFEYIFGNATVAWLDLSYFSDIKGRVVSLFDNSNVLAFYLAIIFPFALDLVSRGRNKREKFLAGISALAIFTCVIFTWSRGAWVAAIASGLLYLLIKTRKTLKAIFACCLALPLTPMIVPNSVMTRFLSIGDMSDSSTFYRVYTWRGSLRALADNLWGGIGYGNSAFSQVYPMYAYAGIEAAEHSHSLYIQILLGMGIVGLVVFAALVLLFAQKSFEYLGDAQSKESFETVAAALSAVAAALIMGLFDYVWYNNRIFFLFWAVLGIAAATVRVGKSKAERDAVPENSSDTFAAIDL